MARARRASPMPATSSAFPADTKESILRDIEIIKRELPVDILEFFFLTPLPGSEDHKMLLHKGVWMDPDMNKYDLNHRVSHHPKMSRRGVGGRLPGGLECLLHARAHPHDPAARGGQSRTAGRSTILSHDPVVQPHDRLRGRASARRRRLPAEVSARPAHDLPLENRRSSSIRATARDRHEGVAILSVFFAARRGKSSRLPRNPIARPTATSRSRRRETDEFEQLSPLSRHPGGEAALARKALGDSIRGAPRRRLSRFLPVGPAV